MMTEHESENENVAANEQDSAIENENVKVSENGRTFENNGVHAEKIHIEKLDINNAAQENTNNNSEYLKSNKIPDLTEEYCYKATEPQQFKFSEIKNIAKKLITSRIVLIACDDYTLGNEAFIGLKDNIEKISESISLKIFNRDTIQLLDTHEYGDQKDNYSSFFSVDAFIKSCRSMNENTWVLTNLNTDIAFDRNRDFLTAFTHPNTPNSYFSQIADQLKSRNQYWVILIPTKTTISECKVTYWPLDQLNTLIKHYCKGMEIDIKLLKLQIEQGIWGKDPISEIHEQMKKERFSWFYIKYRDEPIENENTDTVFPLLICDKHYKYLYKSLLFMICYFPKLSPTFFEEILSVLLKDTSIRYSKGKNQESTRVEQTVNQSENDPINIEIIEGERVIKVNTGQGVKVSQNESNENPRPVTTKIDMHDEKIDTGAWSYWQENKGKVFQKCQITTTSKHQFGESELFMVFSEPAFYKEAELALKNDNPLYLDDFFSTIFHSELLHHRSNDIADAVLNLLQLKMLQEPRSFDAEWLTNWVISILFKTETKISGKAVDIKEYIEKLETMENWKTILYRWTRLFIMLLNEPQLSHIVSDFMDKLINSQVPDSFVLQFVRRLRHFNGFDSIRLIKRLLGQTNPNDLASINKKIHFLSIYIQEQLLLKPELIDKLIEWQPLANKHNNLSSIHIAALKVPFILFIKPINKELLFSKKLPDQIFPVISNCKNIEFFVGHEKFIKLITNTCQSSMGRHFDSLIITLGQTLFMDIAININGDKKEFLYDHILNELFAVGSEYESVLSLMLICWHHALWQSHRKDSDNIAGKKCIDYIVQNIYKNINVKQFKNIRFYLKEIRDRGRVAKRFLQTKKEKKYLSYIIQSTKSLINNLYQLNKLERKEK